MCELAYDLAIAPDDNVSQRPGFETPLRRPLQVKNNSLQIACCRVYTYHSDVHIACCRVYTNSS